MPLLVDESAPLNCKPTGRSVLLNRTCPRPNLSRGKNLDILPESAVAGNQNVSPLSLRFVGLTGSEWFEREYSE